MASVSTAQPPSACGVHNLCAAAQTRQRHPACHALGERRDIGVDAIVLHCKKLACPAKAGLNLVGDQYNAVLVANLERTSVVSGKRVSVRVDPGGSRIIKKKKKT